MSKLRVLDLFSGIGGFSLGLERTGGFETVAFCEIDPFCQRVLAKHWPNVRQFEDVTKLRGEDVGPVDVIAGGFPCQDISTAGEGAGLDGVRSGLWSEIVRLAGELRPSFVLVENVANLLAGPDERPGAWFGRVLGDLASLGYDAEWHSIPASAVGAHHRRDRVWIVAYAPDAVRWAVAGGVGSREEASGRKATARRIQKGLRVASNDGFAASSPDVADANSLAPVGAAIARQERPSWDAEPEMDRVVDGLSYALVEPELRALGNAVVPQIPELIGRAILEARAAA